MRIRWVAVVAGTASWIALPAYGQSYEGTWRTGDTRVEVSVESWGENCAQRPRSHTIPGGSQVEVVREGENLRIEGKRTIQTGTCWSENPGVNKVADVRQEGLWRTRCRTAEHDPRQEHGEYTLRAQGPDRLQYRDVSHYDWQLKGSRCAATITTTQTLERVEPATPATPESEAESETDRKCEPGEPAHFHLHPRETTVRPGERLCFRTRVVDAEGCRLPNADIQWQLQHADGLRARLRGGCFLTPASTAESEGRYRVLARAGSLRAQSTVTVKAVDLSSLIAKRTETGAIVGTAPQPAADSAPQAATDATARVSARPAEPASGGTRWGWLAAALAVLTASALGLWLWKRQHATRSIRGGPEAAAAPAIPLDPEPSPPPRRAQATPATVPHASICPHCRRGYPEGTARCPRDDTPLISYTEFQQQARRRQETQSRRCPRCGATYPGDIAFCGADGAKLIGV